MPLVLKVCQEVMNPEGSGLSSGFSVQELRTLGASELRALESIFWVEQIKRWPNLEFYASGRCVLWGPGQLLSFCSVSGHSVWTRARCFLFLRAYRTVEGSSPKRQETKS